MSFDKPYFGAHLSIKKGIIRPRIGASTANPGRIIVFQLTRAFMTVWLLFRKAPCDSGFHKICDTDSENRVVLGFKQSSICAVLSVRLCKSAFTDAVRSGSSLKAYRGICLRFMTCGSALQSSLSLVWNSDAPQGKDVCTAYATSVSCRSEPTCAPSI